MRSYFLMVCLLLFATFSQAQPGVDSQISRIRSYFQQVNAMKIKPVIISYSTKCGVVKATITKLYNGHDLVKIIDKGIGDADLAASSWVTEYYYEKGQLVFTYERVVDEPKSKPRETRRYYTHDQLIRTTENNRVAAFENETLSSENAAYRLIKVACEADILEIFKCDN